MLSWFNITLFLLFLAAFGYSPRITSIKVMLLLLFFLKLDSLRVFMMILLKFPSAMEMTFRVYSTNVAIKSRKITS